MGSDLMRNVIILFNNLTLFRLLFETLRFFSFSTCFGISFPSKISGLTKAAD